MLHDHRNDQKRTHGLLLSGCAIAASGLHCQQPYDNCFLPSPWATPLIHPSFILITGWTEKLHVLDHIGRSCRGISWPNLKALTSIQEHRLFIDLCPHTWSRFLLPQVSRPYQYPCTQYEGTARPSWLKRFS